MPLRSPKQYDFVETRSCARHALFGGDVFESFAKRGFAFGVERLRKHEPNTRLPDDLRS